MDLGEATPSCHVCGLGEWPCDQWAEGADKSAKRDDPKSGVHFRAAPDQARTPYSTAGLVMTVAGLAATKARGTALGRRHSLTMHQRAEAARLVLEEGKSLGQVAALFRVGRTIVHRAVNEARAATVGLSGGRRGCAGGRNRVLEE